MFRKDFITSVLKIFYSQNTILALTALLIPLTLTTVAWLNARADNELDAHRGFDYKIRETSQTIKKRLFAYEQVLLGGIGLFAASDTVTREEWRIYVSNLLIERNFPGILGIGYSYSFHHSDSLKIVRTIQNEGFRAFRIWPAGIRDEYTTVIYIEPFNERNQRAFGYDLLYEPMRRAAMLEARDNGQTTITGKISLTRETEYNIQAGFLIFIPFYKKNIHQPTIEQRRELFKGYVYSPFKMKDLMNSTLGGELKNINLQIYDGIDTLRKNLMYSSDSLLLPIPQKAIIKTSTLELYGKTWTLKFTALPVFINTFYSEKPTILLLSGLLISLLFFLVTVSFIKSKNTSKKLSGLLESTGEGIFGVNKNLKCTFINQSALRMLNYPLEKCISKSIHEFIHVKMPSGEFYDSVNSPITNSINSGKVSTGNEVILVRSDNRTFPAEYSSHPIFENGIITGAVVTFTDITERKRVLDQIESSLREKEVLLREIHHRVKNNLQIISSLLNLQAGFTTDEKTNEILEESKNRVKSMALIHEKLYQSKNLSSFDIKEFTEELIKNLFNSFGVKASEIDTVLKIDKISFDADQAVYLGLIFNELVSNSLKHAFNLNQADEESHKQITIEIKENSNTGYLIKISDNGCGFPDNLDFRNTDSLGLQLVISLVKQLDAEITMNKNEGTEFTINFKKNS